VVPWGARTGRAWEDADMVELTFNKNQCRAVYLSRHAYATTIC